MTIGARTLPEALNEAARSGEGLTFVVDGVDTRRTYAELERSALGVACAIGEAGLAPGDLVALVIPDAESFLTALLGASIAGVVPAPLYPPAANSDLSQYFTLTAGVLRTVGARAVVTSAALVGGFEAIRGTCPKLAFVLSRDALERPERIEPIEGVRPSLDDIAFVQFTSGSTSAPRGVTLSHRNLSANIDAINGPAGLGTSSRDSAVS